MGFNGLLLLSMCIALLGSENVVDIVQYSFNNYQGKVNVKNNGNNKLKVLYFFKYN